MDRIRAVIYFLDWIEGHYGIALNDGWGRREGLHVLTYIAQCFDITVSQVVTIAQDEGSPLAYF